jgi:hypothetical protein
LRANRAIVEVDCDVEPAKKIAAAEVKASATPLALLKEDW